MELITSNLSQRWRYKLQFTFAASRDHVVVVRQLMRVEHFQASYILEENSLDFVHH